MAGPSDTGSGIAQRLAGTIALWLTLAIGFHVAFWVLLLIGNPQARLGALFGALWNGARYYLPVIVVTMAPPAMLHLFAPRRVALWSKLFLLLSIVLPAGYFMMIRADYLRETARGMHVEGVGLWNVFAYLSMVGLYTSVASLVFAVLLSVREMRTQGRIARGHLGATAAAVILYAALTLSHFAAFFAVLYR